MRLTTWEYGPMPLRPQPGSLLPVLFSYAAVLGAYAAVLRARSMRICPGDDDRGGGSDAGRGRRPLCRGGQDARDRGREPRARCERWRVEPGVTLVVHHVLTVADARRRR